MITIESITKKLGHHPMHIEVRSYEYDGADDDPYKDLTDEENDFIYEYALAHPEEQKIIVVEG